MEALLGFALWIGFIFLMMRFGSGAHIGQHSGQARDSAGNGGVARFRWVPPERAVDPVCSKTVRTDRAKPSVHAGEIYYFCSRDCREIFEAAPDLYLGGGNPDHPDMEHSHA